MPKKILSALFICLLISACGSNKKTVSLNLHSDPLGAYALLQVKYKGEEDSDWIFLGPTPVSIDKSIRMDGASSVSLKVIRPGFFEQIKTWKAKDFIKEQRRNKEIVWVPNMVQQ
jgi:hypothetical protein